MHDALRRGRLVTEPEAILAVVSPDPAAPIRAAELQREREDLAAGKSRYRDHPVAHATRELHLAQVNMARMERNLAGSRTRRAERRSFQPRSLKFPNYGKTAKAWRAEPSRMALLETIR